MRSRKEISFSAALFLAGLLHLLAGAGLKYGKLSAAAPAPGAQSPPVSLRFVEVPPNATAIPEAPKTTFGSDANRKAGPLVPTPRRQQPSFPSARPGPRSPFQGSPAVPAQASTANQPTRPPGIAQGEASITREPQLSSALGDLDRFIQDGGAAGSSGAAAGGDGGDIPTGDPGSGVFFDTQGYDLGPWGNRTVEIVRGNWIIPVAAELGMKGVVGVSFKVDRSGNIQNLKIVSPSGVPSFDQAALRALQSSSPLPPLPADFPRDLLPGIFRFYYNTPVPGS